MRRWTGHSLKAALLLTLLAGASCAPSRTTARFAGSPEEAVQRLNEAYNTGDYDAWVAVLPAEQRRLYEAMNSVADVWVDLVAAANKAFGSDPVGDSDGAVGLAFLDQRPMFAKSAASWRPIEVVEVKAGDTASRATLIVRQIGDGQDDNGVFAVVAVKEQDGWKLGQPGLNAKELNRTTAMWESVAQALHQTAREVRAEAYKDQESAGAALGERLAKIPQWTAMLEFFKGLSRSRSEGPS